MLIIIQENNIEISKKNKIEREREKQLFNKALLLNLNGLKGARKSPWGTQRSRAGLPHSKFKNANQELQIESSLGSGFRLKRDLKARRRQKACHASVKPRKSTHARQTLENVLSRHSQLSMIEDLLDCYSCIVFSLVTFLYLHIRHSHCFLFHFVVS